MPGVTTLDLIVIVVYLAGIVSLGSYCYKGLSTIRDFFLAGRRIGWLPICLSIVATNLSAISYFGCPAMVFFKDLRYSVTMLVFPFCVVAAAYVMASLFYRLQIYTVYEYLEKRFSLHLRLLASSLFLLTKVGWIATAIYTPSLALSVLTGLPLYICIIGIGFFSTLYATMGGMRAVIWTDVIQFFVLGLGIIITAVIVLKDFGGDYREIWAIASERGNTYTFNFDTSFSSEYTVWGILIGFWVLLLYDYGLNQVVVQRYFTAKTLRDSIRGVVSAAFLSVPVQYSLYLLGVGFVAYYARHPDLLESLMASAPDAASASNRVFPHFIAHSVPSGLAGLMIAGVFAATMSSVDSALNSFTSVFIVDIYRRLLHRDTKDEAHYLRMARMCTLFWGALATSAACYVDHLGTVVEIMGKLYGFVTGPLVGMFLLGILSKRANSAGVFMGTILGVVTTFWLSLYSADVHWLWRSPAGLLMTVGAGSLFSLLWESPSEEKLLVANGKAVSESSA